jgi:hypothetical protein
MAWSCDDTRRALRHSTEFPVESLEHLATCNICQEMTELAADVSPSVSSSVDAEMIKTRARLDEERGFVAWLRSRSSRVRSIGAGVFALTPVILQLIFARRSDFSSYPVTWFIAFALAYFALVVWAGFVALSPLYRPISLRQFLTTTLLSLILPWVIVSFEPVPDNHQTNVELNLGILHSAWLCLRYGLALALPAVVALWWFDRSEVKPLRFGLLVGAWGGIVGNFVLLFHCPNEAQLHQWLGHATIGIVYVLVIGFVIIKGRKSR